MKTDQGLNVVDVQIHPKNVPAPYYPVPETMRVDYGRAFSVYACRRPKYLGAACDSHELSSALTPLM